MKLPNAVLLPDNADWKNRIVFDRSPLGYHGIIAQNIKTGDWACSCRAWTLYRTCKHKEMVAGQTVEETIGE